MCSSDLSDVSDADFLIRAGFDVTAPDGGEVWVVNATESITWTTYGSVSDVKLEYSTDGGSIYPNLIAATVSNTGTKAWDIPDDIASNCKVRVSDVTDANALDVSAIAFKIRGAFTLTAPNGAQIWIVGSSENIAWNRTGSIANAKLDYSNDAGLTYGFTIIGSTDASTGTYPWTIPDTTDIDIRVKISDSSDPTVLDDSDADFEIRGSITVTAPNGSEAWQVNQSENITWDYTGSAYSTVQIEYSTDGGGTYPNEIIASTSIGSLGSGSYAWTIPDTIGGSVKVRVNCIQDGNVSDISDNVFKIVGSFTLTSPDGTEEWLVGSSHDITWTKVGTMTSARLEYSTDGGSTYPNMIVSATPAANLSYTWNPIPDTISTTVKVRISDAADATVLDVSNADFSINAEFAVTAPNGTEIWVVGDSHDIDWTNTGTVSNVKLEYSTDGGSTYPNEIIAATPNNNSYSWTIPDAIGTTVRVRVSDVTNLSANDFSDGNFEIQGSLTLTAPVGGEDWVYNTAHDITWTKTGTIATVILKYSTDSGSTYPNTIASGVDATLGTPYSWTLPDDLSIACRVKVTNEADGDVNDASVGDFTIKGSLDLTAPDGAETWIVGGVENIVWTKSGSIANVKLEYSVNSGLTYPNVIIASTAASALSYPWDIPDAIGSELRVKITDVDNSNVDDSSVADFSIKGSVNLTAPDGGEEWNVGESRNINWSKAGTILTIKLEYSINGGSTYPNVIAPSLDASDLTYSWTVPDAIGNQLRVQITNNADASVTDASLGNFTIKGVLDLTSPDGAETWIVDSAHNITWVRTGSIANIKIEYSIDGGTSYPNEIAATTDASTGSYEIGRAHV